MIHRSYTPRLPLSDFVEALWLYEDPTLPHAKDRVLPTGGVDIIINLDEDETRIYDPADANRFERARGTVVKGASSKFVVIDTAEQRTTMGVCFKPGGALPFLGLPVDELHELHLSLDVLWGRTASELRERLLEADTAEAKFHILEQSLLARSSRPLARHPAVAYALREFQIVPQAPTIADVTGRLGLSQRRFIQVFREEVGLTPKLFCRVRRFQQALQLIQAGRRVAWAELALACGYFDQAHFIRDFRAFSGLSPTAYLTQRGQHPNHVPLR